jgi:trimethylamine--corrinoid protein Co-methyltransferase
MLMLDDEICGAALRIARGIEVNEETLALELIKETGYDGNYLAADHTVENFKSELFIPSLYSRESDQDWEGGGRKLALDHARGKVEQVLANHEPRQLDPSIVKSLENFREMAAKRDLTEFYNYEQPEYQDFDNL